MKTTSVLTLFCCAALAFAAAPVDLERKTKVGDKAEYTLLLDFTYPNGSGTFKTNIAEETKSTKEGYEVQRTYKDALVIVGTTEYKQTMPPYNTTYDKVGKVTLVSGDEVGPDTLRFERLWSFVAPGKPVDVGESWKVTEAEDKDADRPAFEMTLAFAAKEAMTGFDCAKVTFNAKETGSSKAAANGTFWIRLSDGATVKTEVELHGAPNSGQAIDGKISYALKP